MQEKFAIVGLGYVGLPVAVSFARKHPHTIGFDINASRIEALKRGDDHTGEVEPDDLKAVDILFTTDVEALKGCTFFIVAVPTPINSERRPDLGPLRAASRTVGQALSKGAVVVYESTVYPGVTEDICGPILESVSGLKRGVDFTLGYSPERINPADKEHTFERIVKVVSGEDAPTLERVARAYESVVDAGVHRASTIKVAEAAKVIENTQRDLNIALMNELAIIFDKAGIRTADVLDAAATKWNFLRFHPGLVGGHCIGVDPYYLTALSQALGYHPEVILAGRRINEGMSRFVAQRLVKLLAVSEISLSSARVAVLGMAFKPNVPDLRNTKVAELIFELREFGVEPLVHDPIVNASEARHEYDIGLVAREELDGLDAVVLAVPHRVFLEQGGAALLSDLALKEGGIVIDVASALNPDEIPAHYRYWSL